MTIKPNQAWEAAKGAPELPALANVDLGASDGDILFFDAELLASRDLSGADASGCALLLSPRRQTPSRTPRR